MATQRSRLSLDVDTGLHEALRRLAARHGTSMRDFCVDTLERRVKVEQTGYLSAEEAPLLAELWDNEDDASYDDAE